MSDDPRLIVRVVEYEGQLMVNACEADLLGRVLVEGSLKVEISPAFYKGGLSLTLSEAIELIKKASIVNLVGNRLVVEVLRLGLAHPRAVRKIDGVAFLMIYKFTSSDYGKSFSEDK